MKQTCTAGAAGIFPKPTIQFLPPELLTIIFTYVHEDLQPMFDAVYSTLSASQRNSDPGGSQDLIKRSLLGQARLRLYEYSCSPICFPYSLANVCPTWRNVLSSTPAFWTNLIFFTDASEEPTSLKDAAHHLSYSRDLPINVTITKRDQSSMKDTTDEEEKASIQSFYQLLLPHIPRWHSVHIDADKSSSLPVFDIALKRDARILQAISLVCDEDDAVYEEDTVDRIFPKPEIASCWDISPTLKIVGLDGRNFNYLCISEAYAPWFALQNLLEQLTVSQFKSDHKLAGLAVSGAMRRIATLESLLSLKLVNLQLLADPHFDAPNVLIDMDHLEDITLVDLEPEVVKEIFRLCSFDSLRVVQLVRCEGLDDDFLAGIDDRLQLVSLDDLSSSFDLCAVVRNWRCASLSLSNCDCVDDAFIDFLTQSEEVAPPTDEGPAPADAPVIGGRRFACADLKILVLAFCSNVSIPMLKKMVEARSHYVDYSDPNWKVNTTYGPALMALIVKRPPSESPVSEEDQKWFSERVPQTLWEF